MKAVRLTLTAILLLLGSAAFASIPKTVSYQGYLTDVGGVPVNSTVSIVFTLYDAESGGTPLWTETQSTVTVSNGIYQVTLGRVTPLELPFDAPCYLGVTVGADPEMTPRQPLTGVPYAFRAATADEVPDGSVTDAKIDGVISPSKGGIGIDSSGAVPGALLRTTGTGTWGALPPGSDGQVLKVISGAPSWGSDLNSGGTVTSVTAGSGLTGGTITGSGTVAIDTAVVPRLGAANTFTQDQAIVNSVATKVPLTVTGAASQSSSLQEWKNSAGTTVASVSPAGVFSGDGSGLTNISAATVTNGVYTTGSYANPAWITSLVGSKISGNISGNAANVTGTVAIANGGTGTTTGSITGSGSLAFTAGGANGSVTIAPTGSGTVDVSAKRITNLAAPTTGTDATNRNYVDATTFAGTRVSRTPQQIATLAWYAYPSYSVGAAPRGIAFDGTNIWVASLNSDNVTKLVASTGAVAGTYTVGTDPYGTAFDGANIWVVNTSSSNVTKLLASNGSLVGTYGVGSLPVGVAFDGTNIWVTNSGSNNVTKLLASDGSFVGTYGVGTTPLGIAFDGTNIWVANNGSNNVTKLLASDGNFVGTYGVGNNPQGVAYDGSNIWVANASSNNVTKLLASNGSSAGTYGVGTNPQGIAFDGTNIWVANAGSNNVSKLLAVTGAAIATYTVGTSPIAVAFDGANVWTTNYANASVTKLPQQ